LARECEQIKAADADRGLFGIGVAPIGDYRERSSWESEKRARCVSSFARRLALIDWDFAHLKIRKMEPTLIWVALATSIRWDVLAAQAQIIVSLPMAETENERLFSIRKCAVCD
jgi:hypothetical protein